MGKDGATSLLSNCASKLLFGLSDEESAQWASSTIGHHYDMLISSRPSGGGQGNSASAAESRQFIVEPNLFYRLRSGGAQHNYIVDCFYVRGLRVFSDGKHFRLLSWVQDHDWRPAS